MTFLKEKSCIYNTSKMDPSNKMWAYYVEINNAALKLAMDDQSLLSNKNKLSELSRKVVHESRYQYKKKKTRSKQFGAVDNIRREYLTETIKSQKLQQIEEDLRDTSTQMSLLECQREKYINVQQFGQAANLTQELGELRTKKRKLELWSPL